MRTTFWARLIAAVAITALIAISLVAQTATSQGGQEKTLTGSGEWQHVRSYSHAKGQECR